METRSKPRSSGPVLRNYSGFHRSISPSGRFSGAASSSFASSSSSSFSSTFLAHRSTSPTRVNFVGSTAPAATVRFSIDRPTSPGRSLSFVPSRGPVVKKPIAANSNSQRKACLCSPSTHPGSFRCSLHKGLQNHQHAVSSSSNRLNARRSAMTNSLVRIGTVEGDLVKRALAALIRPSSHQQRRRAGFQARPSRLSVMSKADDL